MTDLMTYRLQNLMLAMLLALATLFAGLGALTQNPTSGGYQLFERVASGISADSQLVSLGNFAPSPESASEYANTQNRTLPSNYADLGDGWVRGPSGGRAWDTGYTSNGQPVFQREGGGYYTIGADGRQVTTGSPKPHGNTVDNTPTEIYQRVNGLDDSYQKIGVSSDAHRRYAADELGLDRIEVVGVRPRDQAVKIERFIAERWPGPLNNEPWAGARNPSHPNYDPNYVPYHMRGD